MARQLSVKDNPFKVFEEWFESAKAAGHLQPEAAALGTADTQGQPSVRFVLLKGIENSAFYFYTNYGSAKSQDLNSNPKAALCFFWEKIQKQIRIEGSVERVSPSESDAYFKTRPRGSQIGAWASHQSSEISDRAELEKSFEEFSKKFEGQEVPRPENWGGFKILPHRIEFWTGRESRLHDREVFLKDSKAWKFKRLAP